MALAIVYLTVGAGSQSRTPLRTRLVASGFTAPVAVVQDPTDRFVQLVVEQGGRIRVVDGGLIRPTDFLNLSSAIASGGERGLLGFAFAPDYATSGRCLRQLHQPVRRHGDRPVHAVVGESLRGRRGSRFDLRSGRAVGRRSRSRSPTTTAVTSPSAPTGTSTSASATAGRATIRSNYAQNAAELLGKMLRIDVNVPDTDATGYVVPATNPFVGRRRRRGRKSGRSACATPGGVASTIRPAAAPARW